MNRISFYYLSFHGSHFAMEPTLTQGLWMTCGRFFSLLAKKSSYPLNTGGVAGRATDIDSMLGSSTVKKTIEFGIQKEIPLMMIEMVSLEISESFDSFFMVETFVLAAKHRTIGLND